ncbi:MAG: phospho-sugar mutase [Oscillospiraceae bacterium]
MSRERDLYEQWREMLRGDENYTAELESIEDEDDEIVDRFYRDLEFGTGGLRGVLGLGTNRMNVFTVGRATQGLSGYVLEKRNEPSVAIAYDSRNRSHDFAVHAACIFAANGVKVHLYQELMPTPVLSFAVRELKCDAGVVITASHNPAIYNGYKAYGDDGCQFGPEQADTVMKYMEQCDTFEGVKAIPYDEALGSGMIQLIPESFVQFYLDRVWRESLQPEVFPKAGLKIVYTPLNGAGNRPVREILAKAGVTDITVVPEQEMPDGNFPTAPYPNPEMREALTLGIALSEKENADILLATDPDCDRAAVAVRTNGDMKILTGNEVGILLLDYILKTRKALGKLPEHPLTIRSIVSSKLADKIAEEYSAETVEVLTGFKFIGSVIGELEDKGELNRFVFGWEESCGYLSGSYVRDKDAVNASLLIVEMASAYKLEGKTLDDVLQGIYRKYGIYRNALQNVSYPGAEGMLKMKEIMDKLRQNPPTEIAGTKVVEYTDYLVSERTKNGVKEPIAIPSSNVLEYGLGDGSSVIIRPSGTEPKIKLYYSLVGESEGAVESLEKKYVEACSKLIG